MAHFTLTQVPAYPSKYIKNKAQHMKHRNYPQECSSFVPHKILTSRLFLHQLAPFSFTPTPSPGFPRLYPIPPIYGGSHLTLHLPPTASTTNPNSHFTQWKPHPQYETLSHDKNGKEEYKNPVPADAESRKCFLVSLSLIALFPSRKLDS
ncbi:hypothetical protein BGZ60DRAFT_188811 [Tricladium varicosporioides]|nr:hypothetical protein BGZ60DRAFT_188811 [Hymenoscyphus varicosporioides]